MAKIQKGDKRKPKVDDNGELIVTKTGSIAGVGGRPPGSTNKATLFKQAMKDGFEKRLEQDGIKVFNAVVQKAIGPPSVDKEGNPIVDENGNQMYIDGDSTAQKMLMDRLIPVADVVGSGEKGKLSVTVNVMGMESKISLMDDKPIDADFEEIN